MGTPAAARLLLQALAAPRRAGDGPPSSRTEALRRALLDYGSETEDNLAAAQRLALEVDTTPHDASPAGVPGLAGLAAAVGSGADGARVQVADVLNAAEGCPVPEQVAEALPELTQEDWDAVLRLATLLFTAAAAATIPDEEA